MTPTTDRDQGRYAGLIFLDAALFCVAFDVVPLHIESDVVQRGERRASPS